MVIGRVQMGNYALHNSQKPLVFQELSAKQLDSTSHNSALMRSSPEARERSGRQPARKLRRQKLSNLCVCKFRADVFQCEHGYSYWRTIVRALAPARYQREQEKCAPRERSDL